MKIPIKDTKDVVLKPDQQLRLFSVQEKFSIKPASDQESGKWQVASHETINAFSAVPYYFGNYIRENYDVPIGLVSAAVGGKNIIAFPTLMGIREPADGQAGSFVRR